MIGIEGRNGEEGYRWLPPKPSEVRDGQVLVIPYPAAGTTRWSVVLSTLAIVATLALRHTGAGAPDARLAAVAYPALLAMLMAAMFLRGAGWFRRRPVQVGGMLRFVPLRPQYWIDLVFSFSAISGVLDGWIRHDHPQPPGPWEGLLWIATLACLGFALAPWFSRHVLRRRGLG
ncbi:MAG: hypothetical protein AB1832_16320 [Pseudomonadota bacterium]